MTALPSAPGCGLGAAVGGAVSADQPVAAFSVVHPVVHGADAGLAQLRARRVKGLARAHPVFARASAREEDARGDIGHAEGMGGFDDRLGMLGCVLIADVGRDRGEAGGLENGACLGGGVPPETGRFDEIVTNGLDLFQCSQEILLEVVPHRIQLQCKWYRHSSRPFSIVSQKRRAFLGPSRAGPRGCIPGQPRTRFFRNS